jgi:hypothetical protein
MCLTGEITPPDGDDHAFSLNVFQDQRQRQSVVSRKLFGHVERAEVKK